MRIRNYLAIFCVLVTATFAPGQDTRESPDVAELIRRLEQAEARIRSLESQIDDKQSQTSPTDAETETLIPIADSSEVKEAASEPKLIERLAELEKSYKKDKEDTAKAKAKKPNVKIGGRINLDYWGHPSSDPGVNVLETGNPNLTPQERITYRRLRIHAEGDISDTMFYKLETEFADPNNFQFRDVLIGFTELPILQTVIIGHQKRPLGLDYWNSAKYNPFIERPLTNEAFNELNRRVGVVSYGVSRDQYMNWQLGVYNLEDLKNDGDYRNDHLQLSFNGRVSGTPWYDESSGGRGYLHLGVSTMVAQPDGDATNTGTRFNEARFRTPPSARTSQAWLNTGRIAQTDMFETVGLESLLTIGALSLSSEYMGTWVQRDGGLDDLYFHGAHVQAAYWLTGEYFPYDKKKGAIGRPKLNEDFFLVKRCCGGIGGGWGAWQIAARAQYLDLTDQDILGGKGYSADFGVNWWWNAYARLQFNYIVGRITDHEQINGNSAGGDYSILGWRMMVDF